MQKAAFRGRCRAVLAALSVACGACEPRAAATARPLPTVPGRLPAAEEEPLVTLVRATVVEWSAAHNEHDRRRLQAVYDTRVRYARFSFPIDLLLRTKEAFFSRSPSARQEVSEVVVDRSTPGLPRARFTKTVRSATFRVTRAQTELSFSCDSKRCLIVDEEDDAFLESYAVHGAAGERRGSCAEAVLTLAASTPDGKRILGDRPGPSAARLLASPPGHTHFVVLLLDGEGAPAALYEIAAATMEITEAFPGDVIHKGEAAAIQIARRSCTPL